MRAKKLSVVLYCIFIFFTLAHLSAAPKIKIKVSVKQGGWTIDLDAANLLGGAGTDFVGTIESDWDKVDVDISKTADPTAPWRVDISKVDTNWPSSLRLYAKRTADGTGDGTINEGTTYQQIIDSDQSFFSGTGDRTGIKVQLKIEGVSVVIGEDTYDTTIYYTVTET